MSYILDALRKSEKERRHGEMPTVLTEQDSRLPAPRRRGLWRYVLLVALVVNAVILLWVFSPRDSKVPPAPADVSIARQSAPDPSVSESATSRTDAAGGKDGDAVTSSPEKTAAPAREKTRSKSDIQSQRNPSDTSAPRADASSDARPQERPPATDAPDTKAPQEMLPPAQNRIYSMEELPPGLREKLPSITLSLTVHSDDRASRLATINGQTVREGHALAGNVKVEEISSDSVILSSQGYRFRLPMR